MCFIPATRNGFLLILLIGQLKICHLPLLSSAEEILMCCYFNHRSFQFSTSLREPFHGISFLLLRSEVLLLVGLCHNMDSDDVESFQKLTDLF